MAKSPKVTKVTVEYAFERQTFRVEFNPEKIDAIVFGRTDLERLLAKQNEGKSEAEKVKPKRLNPRGPFSADAEGVKVSDPLGTTTKSNGTVQRSLWWHASSCNWFHPEENDQS